MQEKYYDEWEFQKAQSHKTLNPFEAAKKFEEYLKQYPKDYITYAYYASSLITIGELDKAEKVLNYVENLVHSDERFATKESYKMNSVVFAIVYNKLRLYSYKGDYKKVYELGKNNPKQIQRLNLNDLMFYCKRKMMKANKATREPNSYLFRQIVEYKEEDFFEHIQKHMADYNSNLDEPNKNVFVPDFPIKDVVKEIKKYIPSSKKMLTGFWENTYVFRYDCCGRENNKLVNYIKVVCFDKTDKVITILPVSAFDNLPQVDLNYMVKDNKKEIKRENAIDKFNRRFRRN